MSGISACMIVRDEASRLGKCLEALSPWVDEINVVDTGSQDTTIAIAERHGARVRRLVWQDDFAAARNVSLEMATQPWILVVDADELLREESGEALRKIAQEGQSPAFLVHVDNLSPRGDLNTVAIPRLFQNRVDIRFSRPVHESIMESLRSIGVDELPQAGVRLLHSGYLPEVVAEKEKYVRNARILRARVAEEQEDLFSLYKLARTLSRTADHEERLQTYRLAWLQTRSMDREDRMTYAFLPLLYAGYADTLVDAGELGYALRVVTQGLRDVPDAVELIFRRGDLAYRVGDYEGARRYLQACFRPRRVNPVLVTDPLARTVKPAIGLAHTFVNLGDSAEAMRQLDRTLGFDPTYWPAHCLKVKLCLADGESDMAMATLDELLEKAPTRPAVQLLGGELSWMQGDVLGAVEMWEGVRGYDDSAYAAQSWLAVGEVAMGFYSRAASRLSTMRDRDLASAAARLFVAVSTGEVYERGNFIPNYRLVHRLVLWLRELIGVGAEAALENFAVNAPMYRVQVPGVEQILQRDSEPARHAS